ncbi:MAG TPA: MFS transporter [Caulobacteraceae bacterium]|nr:MFS transporter [Caulobacteraceae bacterium]
MSAPARAEAAAADVADAAPLPAAERGEVFVYAGLILLILNFAAPVGGFLSTPLTFFMKNRLHLQAHQLAAFNFWTGLPLYLAFAFGFLRDRWSPLGAGDRGHLALFGAATAAIFAGLAFVEPTYGALFVGVLAATALLQIVGAAANGLITSIGQARAVSGEASAIVNISTCAPAVAGYALGGVLSGAMEGEQAGAAARTLFLAAAGLMALAALLGALGPKRVFAEEPQRPTMSALADIGRLLRAWPVVPPLIMLALWDFAPAMGAVLPYHLADALHASDADVGLWYALFYAANIPSLAAYFWLCRRVRLSRLIVIATLIAIPQMAPLLFVHSVSGALLAAIPMGLMGGLASAAYIDLAIRACPAGLQGTLMMLILGAIFYAAARLGDLWGASLYDTRGGFTLTVIASIGVYALILPVLALADRRLMATRDGEAAIA